MEHLGKERSNRFDDFSEYFRSYIQRVSCDNPLEALTLQLDELEALLGNLSDEQAGFRYAEGKWSIKEMMVHISDTERIMTYRALRAARNDSTLLPSFDENAFAAESFADERPFSEILNEWRLVRLSAISFFESLNELQWMRIGRFSGSELSVEGIAFLIAGHFIHHVEVLSVRYNAVIIKPES
jgi:hypothetical protein